MTSVDSYKKTIYAIIGSAMEVHKELNFGLLEAVYQEALSLELTERGIDNQREQEITIYYKHKELEKKYKMDIVAGDVVVELKSTSCITTAHRAQLCNYLRLTQKPIGLLINFGEPKLIGERWILDKDTNECYLVDKDMNIVFEERHFHRDWQEYNED